MYLAYGVGFLDILKIKSVGGDRPMRMFGDFGVMPLIYINKSR